MVSSNQILSIIVNNLAFLLIRSSSDTGISIEMNVKAPYKKKEPSDRRNDGNKTNLLFLYGCSPKKAPVALRQ